MIKLRAFEKSDLAAAFRLDQVCFPPGIAYSLSELTRFLSRPSAFALVAENVAENGELPNRLAAFLVALHRPGSKNAAAHIVTIDVAPEQRRNGVATSLMEAAEAHYRHLACTTMVLEVAVDNAAALAFYRQRGYTPVRLRRGYYNGILDAYTMSKPL